MTFDKVDIRNQKIRDFRKKYDQLMPIHKTLLKIQIYLEELHKAYSSKNMDALKVNSDSLLRILPDRIGFLKSYTGIEDFKPFLMVSIEFLTSLKQLNEVAIHNFVKAYFVQEERKESLDVFKANIESLTKKFQKVSEEFKIEQEKLNQYMAKDY